MIKLLSKSRNKKVSIAKLSGVEIDSISGGRKCQCSNGWADVRDCKECPDVCKRRGGKIVSCV